MGTDSGFEGFTTLYYARIAYTLTEVADPGPGATGSGLTGPLAGGGMGAVWVAVGLAVGLAGLAFLARRRLRGGAIRGG